MIIIGWVLEALLWTFLALLWIRFVAGWVQVFARSWVPHGVVLVLLELTYSATDPADQGAAPADPAAADR